jgi:sterol 24-C-methyltransferase
VAGRGEAHADVIGYYRRWESRASYRLLLGGTRHFGYYPSGAGHVPARAALAFMEERLGRAIGLPAGARVLDAGCGRGHAAMRLAAEFGYRVHGVDLLAEDVARARAEAARRGLGGLVSFAAGDYAALDVPDGCFDAAFTLETLVHAPDAAAALAEFARVLAPGGRLVLFEYSVAPPAALTPEQRALLAGISAGSAMHSMPGFVHGRLAELVAGAGFEGIEVADLTERMLPMLRWLARVLWLPYQAARLLGAGARVVNSAAAVQVARHPGLWRYNAVTARRAGPRAAP